MSELIEKAIDAKIHWIITIGGVIIAIAATFYSQTTRIAVLTERQEQLERRVTAAEDTAAKYQSLAQSIDSRLSRIEGALAAAK